MSAFGHSWSNEKRENGYMCKMTTGNVLAFMLNDSARLARNLKTEYSLPASELVCLLLLLKGLLQGLFIILCKRYRVVLD